VGLPQSAHGYTRALRYCGYRNRPAVARPPSPSRADGGAGERHSLRRCRVWASVRAARRRNRSSARTAGALAKAFEGFRIAQLSDIHIGPFTTADYIRHCVAITNGLERDLIALTGDYISWTGKPRATWLVCWRACGRLTAFSDAWETMRRKVRLKSPSLACSPLKVSICCDRSAHPSGWVAKRFNLIGIDHGGDHDRRLQELKALVIAEYR